MNELIMGTTSLMKYNELRG